jgi:hypothetical protein
MAHTQVDCKTTAIALATLNIAVALADKQSLDGSLNEAQIAPDFQSIKDRLLGLVKHIRDHCPAEQPDILQGITFSQGQ